MLPVFIINFKRLKRFKPLEPFNRCKSFSLFFTA